jgi:hypothetical protein
MATQRQALARRAAVAGSPIVVVNRGVSHALPQSKLRGTIALLRAEWGAVEVSDLDRFDGVVLGSAVYMGHWLEPARKFVERWRGRPRLEEDVAVLERPGGRGAARAESGGRRLQCG